MARLRSRARRLEGLLDLGHTNWPDQRVMTRKPSRWATSLFFRRIDRAYIEARAEWAAKPTHIL